MMPLLTILVPTVPSRVTNFFPSLMLDLERQCADRKDVEIIGFYDNKSRTLGEKRTNLLKLARGEYLVFLDDDDEIHQFYVEKVCKLLQEQPCDVLVYDQIVTFDGKNPKRCRYGLEFTTYNDGPTLYTAHPVHTMPWRTALVQGLTFPHQNFSEDSDWSQRASRMAKTQSRIEEVMYFYNFNKATTETRNVTKAVQSIAQTITMVQNGTKEVLITMPNQPQTPAAPPKDHYLARRAARREQDEAIRGLMKRKK